MQQHKLKGNVKATRIYDIAIKRYPQHPKLPFSVANKKNYNALIFLRLIENILPIFSLFSWTLMFSS
jgi:hypothetical protein